MSQLALPLDPPCAPADPAPSGADHGMGELTQLALPLAWPPDPQDDAFLLSPSNERAVRLLADPAAWPVSTALLTGPRKSGRTLLARIAAVRTGLTVIDDADRRGETELFHAWNRAQEERRPLLLVAEAAPPAWAVSLPDLRSRLAASPVAAIEAPDDALMAALLERLFAQARLDARPDLVAWLASRLERSHLAVWRAVDLLDAGAMATHRRLSIALARNVLGARSLIAQPATESR